MRAAAAAKSIASISAMCAGLWLSAVPAAPSVDVAPVPGQSLSGFHLTEAFADREDGWNEHRAELWFAAGGLRLDVWTPGAKDTTHASVLLPPGKRGALLMLRHPNRQFDECSLARLVDAGDAFRPTSWPMGDDLTAVTARSVEQTRPVNQWTTAAVELLRGPPEVATRENGGRPRRRGGDDPDAFGRVWFTEEAGIELHEVRSALEQALHPYGPSLAMHSMWLLLVAGLDEERIDGLPAGVPVALELGRLGQLGATSQISSIARLTLTPALFEIPAGYSRGNLCPGR